MMELNDYELLDKVSEDEFATEVLFKKYRPLIYNTAKKFYYGNKDSGIDLNDLIQEGMIGFSTAINTFNDQKDAIFFTYAKTCISRRIISFVIGSQRLKHQLLNESISVEDIGNDGSLEKIFSDSKNDPEIKLIDDENTKELFSNINKSLTDFESQVFQLKATGFNYKDIADILDKDPKSISNALERIKLKASKYIKNAN